VGVEALGPIAVTERAAANYPHLFLSQNVPAVVLAPGRPVSRYPVGYVVLMRTNREVRRIAADGVVTGVSDDFAGRYAALRDPVGDAMRRLRRDRRVNPELAVSVPARAVAPRPALILLADFDAGPKSRNDVTV
jgi:hypothetical protein